MDEIKKSFTLIELLIVLVIIGILATLAVPQYENIIKKAKWAEANGILSYIKITELEYYAESGKLADRIEGTSRASILGFESPNTKESRYFDYYFYGLWTSQPDGPLGSHYFAIKKGETPAVGVSKIMRFGVFQDGSSYFYPDEEALQAEPWDPQLL